MDTLVTNNIAFALLNKTAPIGQFSWGESIFFWVVSTLMVLLAIGVAVSRKAVHAAVCMVGVMLGLAMIYVSQGAYFIGVVQVVVYTGAVMALILFILMMVGIAASDNYLRTSRILRLGAWGTGIAGAVLLSFVLIVSKLPETGGIPALQTAKESTESNPVQIAITLFRDHMFTMELVSCLLIIAAVGAMLLTHAERLRPQLLQPETANLRMLDYGKQGTHPGQKPAPGVYQETNAADMPAIDGERGEVLHKSVPPALRARNAERVVGATSPKTIDYLRADHGENPIAGMHSLEASQAVKRSGAWGMPGTVEDNLLEATQTQAIKPSLAEIEGLEGNEPMPVDEKTDNTPETAEKGAIEK